jgi:S-formylglutathione hydrolase FrmB
MAPRPLEEGCCGGMRSGPFRLRGPAQAVRGPVHGRGVAWPYGRAAAAIAAGTAVVLIAVLSGTVDSSDTTLVLMGFDPDRAQLISSLLVGGVAASAAALVLPRARAGTLIGAAVVAAMFGPTFESETANALAATGALGTFSAIGWLTTLITLAVIGVMSAWAGAVIGAAVRPSLIATLRDALALVGRGQRRSHLRRPLAALLVLAILAVTVPSFGDMVNLSPDALMLGGVQRVPLVPPNGLPSPGASAGDQSGGPTGPAAQASQPPAVTPPGETPSASQGAGSAGSGSRPWLAWLPTGNGLVTTLNMAAPWTGGTATTVDVSIYTPPGYAIDTTRRYPVLYEAPTGLGLWGSGTGAIGALDSLIDSGAMPASIVVFIDSLGAPYPDTECANSFDGRMWMETFISKTVPEYVDTHYRALATASARALMGMSAGGFCAAMVTLRHPDVFATSISFSGYYYAGIANATSGLPFGSAAGLSAHSPARLLATIDPTSRDRLFLVVVADPSQQFYGPQAANFESMLKADHFEYATIQAPMPHGWPQVRYEFPAAAAAWAGRLAAVGVV